MTGRYKLSRRCLYYNEEKEFKNIFEEKLWIIRLRINGWKIKKLAE